MTEQEIHGAALKAANEVYARVVENYEKILATRTPQELEKGFKAVDVEIDAAWLPILTKMFEKDGFECFRVDDTAEQDWVIAVCIQPKQ